MASAFLSFIAAFMLLQLVNSEEYCAMYDVCGKRSDGVVLNCPYGSPPVEPDKLFSAQIQSLCPTMTGNVCCNELQFQTLQLRVELATKFLGGCPACLRNYLNLFCELSCSPNQSRYVDVTSVSKVTGNMIVARVDYYISDTFGQGLYNSCKDVKFGGSRSMDMVGAGAKNYEEWFDVLGKKSSPAVPAPPYVIEFKFPTSESSNIQFMNVSAYSCADTSLHCSCDDCPSRLKKEIGLRVSGKKKEKKKRSPIYLVSAHMLSKRACALVVVGKALRVTLMLPTLQDCGQLAWGIAYFMGSCSWWIVKVYFRICWDPRFFFGIILGARVDLPSQSTIPCSNSDQPSFFCKVIASSVPTTAPPCDCLVAAICSDGGLAFCSLTDKVWTCIDHARHLVFDDIEITGGKLYAAPKWTNEVGSQFMMVFDIQNICSNGGGCPSTFTIDQMFEIRLPVVSPPLREARPFDLVLKITCHNIHLAKDSTTNDLFMIIRENNFVIEKNPPVPWAVVIGDTNYIIPPKTRGFRVFKLEKNADGHPGWLEIFDLGDRIMFLSAAANKILVANASNGLCSDHLRDKLLETNCIYFAFDHSCLSLTSILETFLDPWHILVTPMVDRHDVGVFSLKDCKIRPLGNFPDHRTQLRARSVWFTPNNA